MLSSTMCTLILLFLLASCGTESNYEYARSRPVIEPSISWEGSLCLQMVDDFGIIKTTVFVSKQLTKTTAVVTYTQKETMDTDILVDTTFTATLDLKTNTLSNASADGIAIEEPQLPVWFDRGKAADLGALSGCRKFPVVQDSENYILEFCADQPLTQISSIEHSSGTYRRCE